MRAARGPRCGALRETGARDDRQRRLFGERREPRLADGRRVQHDVAAGVRVVAQARQRALRLRDPRHPLAVDDREPREFAAVGGEPIQHRLADLFDARGGEVPEAERRELQRQRVVLRVGMLLHEPALGEAREQPVRDALRQRERAGDRRQRKPVRRVGQQFQDVERAVGGWVHRAAGAINMERRSDSMRPPAGGQCAVHNGWVDPRARQAGDCPRPGWRGLPKTRVRLRS